MTSDHSPDSGEFKRSRIALTSKTKKQVREMVGKCEYCDRPCPPDALEVFQLGMLSRFPNRPEENPGQLLVVLCQEHFTEATAGTLLKTTLRSKIAKRPDKLKKSLRSLLQKHDRTYEGSNVRETHDPNRFTVGAFLKKNPDDARK
ncbi:hypothetical protein [Methanoregula sp.]|uniref:hypothetical protein n=1 Tax=Methanoregula sp. TaxID=2052170 RepID=UPI002C378FA5|nr:hypothetical protein [Methanoregula sp.]HVP96408.1 hypothetical protein [Methanoregula sp.]